MTAATSHTKACLEAWMNCEDVLLNIVHVHKPLSPGVARIVDECGRICISTFHALRSNSVNLNRYALLCIGICEECAELCDEFHDTCFKQCAKACRTCSNQLLSLPCMETPAG